MCVEDVKKLTKDFPFQIEKYKEKKRQGNLMIAHRHRFFEITCVERGCAEYFVNGQKYRVEEGDLIIFNHVEEHSWNILTDEMQLKVLLFSSVLVTDGSPMLDAEYLIPFLERGKTFENRIPGKEKEAGEIRGLMAEIQLEDQAKRTGSRLMIKADILKILTILVRYYEKKETAVEFTAKKKEYIRRIERAIDLLKENYSRKITLEEAAAAVCMSPNYFSSYFRKATGSSFQEYLTKIRMEKARELLHCSGEGILDIAQECGVGNAANFYRLYKKYYGIAPGEERHRGVM